MDIKDPDPYIYNLFPSNPKNLIYFTINNNLLIISLLSSPYSIFKEGKKKEKALKLSFSMLILQGIATLSKAKIAFFFFFLLLELSLSLSLSLSRFLFLFYYLILPFSPKSAQTLRGLCKVFAWHSN